jgi:hypothetical protein
MSVKQYEAIHSPLWMVTQQQHLNRFVLYLRSCLDLLNKSNTSEMYDEKIPDHHKILTFSKTDIRKVKDEFSAMIRNGEEVLHQLADLLCHTFFNQEASQRVQYDQSGEETYQPSSGNEDFSFKLQSVVIGEVLTSKERFTLMQNISPEELRLSTDLDLGNRQLSKLKFFDGRDWSGAALVSNVVEYQPTIPNIYGIHKILSRIKAEEEIWNKVVDEIFDIDSLIQRDKKLVHLSRYVKDVFGLKIITGTIQEVQKLHRYLQSLTWEEAQLRQLEIPVESMTRQLEFIETKDYLNIEIQKQSGWQAMKSVVLWSGKMIEIQVQVLHNYLNEQEMFTKESHRSFKTSRENIRNEIAEKYPLFRFYRDLLRWLFMGQQGDVPQYEGVIVQIQD